jgi:hypothetical protein
MTLIAGFDIFRLEGASAPQWVSAVADFVAAKARIESLMKDTPCDYMIFSAATGQRTLVKAPVEGKQKQPVRWTDSVSKSVSRTVFYQDSSKVGSPDLRSFF